MKKVLAIFLAGSLILNFVYAFKIRKYVAIIENLEKHTKVKPETIKKLKKYWLWQ